MPAMTRQPMTVFSERENPLHVPSDPGRRSCKRLTSSSVRSFLKMLDCSAAVDSSDCTDDDNDHGSKVACPALSVVGVAAHLSENEVRRSPCCLYGVCSSEE